MRQSRLFLLALLALACLVLSAISPPSAQARVKQASFVDDDWDPVWRGGRTYNDDPGYEFWIQEALDLTGIPYDVHEVQTSPTVPADIPTLAELRAYPLVLWNCAAEADTTLTFEEREVIRQYADLGGRVVLLGQGILNDFANQWGNPEVEDFVHNYMGISTFILDQEYELIIPDPSVPYISPITTTALDYSLLPDDLPFFSDPFFPNEDAFLFAQSGTEMLPASSDRFRPNPIHFQGFMMEAIPNANVRADYLLALMEWLGLEGDILEDLMNDTGGFSETESCPDNSIIWSTTENAFVFSANGIPQNCKTVWEYGVTPENACGWRMGFTHQVDTVGQISEMVLMELTGPQDILRISIFKDYGTPGNYVLNYYVLCNGVEMEDVYIPNLGINQIRRTHVSQTTGPLALHMKLMDKYGNIIHQTNTPGCLLDFDKLYVRTVEVGQPSALPLEGWIDDYFFEGCLEYALQTQVPETPAPLDRLRAYPNPFNPKVQIQYSQAESGPLDLAVYDLSGRRVITLFEGHKSAGEHSTEWDGRDVAGRKLASGVYLLNFESAVGNEQRKLVLLK